MSPGQEDGDSLEPPPPLRTRSHSTPPSRSPAPLVRNPTADVETESTDIESTKPTEAGSHSNSNANTNTNSHNRSKSYVYPGQGLLSHVHRPGHGHGREREGTDGRHQPQPQRGTLRRIHGHEKTDSFPHLVVGLRKEGERRANAEAAAVTGGHGHEAATATASASVSASSTTTLLPSKKSAAKIIPAIMMSSRIAPAGRDAGLGVVAAAVGAESKVVPVVLGSGTGPETVTVTVAGGQQEEVKKKKKSQIEEELEQSEKRRLQQRFNITAADVAQKDEEIDEAEQEMRERLDEANARGIELARWLDYTYYNLLENLGHVVDTLNSFQSLTQQSKQLITEFDHQSWQLDDEITTKIAGFSDAFGEREDRLTKLVTKGRELNSKAEELGKRLERAREAVNSWEKKEDKSKKVWSRFWSGISWSLVVVFLIGLLLSSSRSIASSSARPRPGGISDTNLTGAKLPDDVRSLLREIEDRSRKRKEDTARPVKVAANGPSFGAADTVLGILDEL